MTAMFTLASSAWRFRNDDGSETTATWMAAQNVQPANIAAGTLFRLRFRAGDTGGASGTITPRIYYSQNGGAYAAVGTTTPVKFADSPNIAGNPATTSQLTGGGGGTFVAGAVREDNSAAAVNLGASGNEESEWVLVFDVAQVTNGDTFTFRIADGTTVLTAVTATVLVAGAPPQTVSPSSIAPEETFGTATISGGISATDDSYLDEAGQVWLDETSQPILIPEIPKGIATWGFNDFQSETGLDINDETGAPIRMPVAASGPYEYWNGTVWIDVETFLNLTSSPATITNWPNRLEMFELGIRAKDSGEGVSDYSDFIVGPAQAPSPGAIASAEAFGNPTMVRGPVTLSPGGIASAQAFGVPTIALTGAITISAAGAIASAEAFGTPVLLRVITVSPSGIASAGVFGVVVIGGAVTLLPSGIATAQAFGTPVVTVGILTILPGGIASLQAFGNPSVLPGARTLSPRSIYAPGVGHLKLPGSAGDYVSTPDSPAFAIIDDIDIRVDLAADDWTPASVGYIIGQRNGSTATTISYQLSLLATGRLEFAWGDGSGARFNGSTVSTGFVDGSRHWIRVTRVRSTGVITFYTSEDGVIWTQLGAPIVSATTAIYDHNVNLTIGADVSGNSNRYTGKIYKAEIRNGIGGSVVFSMDFNDPAQIQPGDTAGVASTGQIVSLFGTATVESDGLSLGTPALSMMINLLPAGIASLQAFGNPTVIPGGVVVLVPGIASAEAFGLVLVKPPAPIWLDVGLNAKGLRLVPGFDIDLLPTAGDIKLLRPTQRLLKVLNEVYAN